MKAIIFTLVSIAILSTSCNQNNNSKSTTNVQHEKAAPNTNSVIPYVVAERYFTKNTVEDANLTLQITSKNDFDKYFGSATVMGNDGKPTPIDFSKQYAITVIGKKSNNKVNILPLSLESENNTITLQYKEETEEKQTHTSRALLILLVDKKYNGNIKFERK